MLKVPGSIPTETIDFFVILREQVCSMVNIGEGNLYVTCIKGFVYTGSSNSKLFFLWYMVGPIN